MTVSPLEGSPLPLTWLYSRCIANSWRLGAKHICPLFLQVVDYGFLFADRRHALCWCWEDHQGLPVMRGMFILADPGLSLFYLWIVHLWYCLLIVSYPILPIHPVTHLLTFHTHAPFPHLPGLPPASTCIKNIPTYAYNHLQANTPRYQL